MPALTIRAWEVADVDTVQIREACEDPALADLRDGPAKRAPRPARRRHQPPRRPARG